VDTDVAMMGLETPFAETPTLENWPLNAAKVEEDVVKVECSHRIRM
jgi:hypothetical protein